MEPAAVPEEVQAPQPLPAPAAEERPYESIAAYVALGDARRALEEYERLFKERPKDYETRLLYARLLVMAGLREEAGEALAVLLAERPADADTLYLSALLEGLEGRPDRQRELLEKALASAPDHADALSALGELLLAERRNGEAQALFDAAVAKDPENTVALQGMATIAMDDGRYDKAKELLTRVVEREPDNVFAYVDRAKAEEQSGDSQAAVKDLGRAIDLDPEFYWSYIDRAKLLIARGELQASILDLDRAVALDGSYFLAYVFRGQVHYQLGRIPEATEDFQSLVERRPDYSYAYGPLATCLYMQEAYGKAREAFERAYASQQEDASLALLVALCYKKEGKESEARRYLNQIVPGLDRTSWQYEVGRYYLNPSNDFTVVSVVSKEKKASVKYRMLFYLASQHLLLNKKLSASSYFAEVAEVASKLVFRTPSVEKLLAEWELGRLEGKAGR